MSLHLKVCVRERELIVETQRKDSFFFSPYFFDNRFIGRAFLLLPVCTKLHCDFIFAPQPKTSGMGCLYSKKNLILHSLSQSLSVTVCVCVGE